MKGRAFVAVVLSALLLLSGLGIGGWWLLWQRGPLQLAHHRLAMPRAARFVPASATFSLYLYSDGQRPVDYARAVAPARQRRTAGEAIARLRDGAFAAAGLDYHDELAGWLGGDIAMALVKDPVAAAAGGTSEAPAQGWLLALASRDDDGARRFLQRFWQTRSLAGTGLQVSRYRGMGLISGRGALLGSPSQPLATALVDDDLVLIASGRNLLERALDVSQIPELNQAGQPLLRQGVASFATGAALAVASPEALESWLGLPSLEGLSAAPLAGSPPPPAPEVSPVPPVMPPANRSAAGAANQGDADQGGAGVERQSQTSGPTGASRRSPAAVAVPLSAEVGSDGDADQGEAGAASAPEVAPPPGAADRLSAELLPTDGSSAVSSGSSTTAPATSPASSAAGDPAAVSPEASEPPPPASSESVAGPPDTPPAAEPDEAAPRRAAPQPLPQDRPAPSARPIRAPWTVQPANALSPTSTPQAAPAAPSLLAVLQPQGRQLELRARLLLPRAPRLRPLQAERVEPLLAALRGSPSSLALVQDPAVLGQDPLLRRLLERSLGLWPAPVAERQGPLPSLLARSMHGPLVASQASLGWQLASRAGDPVASDLEPLLQDAGLLEAPLSVDGHSLRVWTHLSWPGRTGRTGRAGADVLVAPLAGWSEQRQDLAWWGQTLALLEAPAESRALTGLRRGLRELGAPQAPLQWSLDGEGASALLRSWQPWRLLSALAGGGLDAPVRGLALAVQSPPDASALELRARLNLGD